MADLHIRIEVSGGQSSSLSKALRQMREFDPDFPSFADGQSWWHKPPDNARALLARCLSRHGLTGRLTVVEHDGESAWDTPPDPVWTGFTAVQKFSKAS